MPLVALLVALSGPPSAPLAPLWGTVGRVYTSSTVHVGVRGALLIGSFESALGATVQITL